MNKIFYKNIGCKVNNYELNSICSIFFDNNYEYDQKNPDVVLINTCSVTSQADKKSRNYISRYRKKYKNSILIVMGCFIQGLDEYVINKIDADIIIGNVYKNEIFDLVNKFKDEHKKIIKLNKKTRKVCYEEISHLKYFSQTRAYIKIQDGCNKFCSYCLIPYIRLESRSRKKEDILIEIDNLLKSNYKEIVLTGIDVSSYGLDLYENYTFSDLLEEILNTFNNYFRLRISSIEESMIDDKFLYLLSKDKRICDHMHLSLQSGSDKVLKLMNRRYTSSDFLKKVNKIFKVRPLINLTTDVIVGFPGENTENFLETVEFVKKCNFSKIHVFPYSDRKGTAASKFPNHVNDVEKKKRVDFLLNISKELEKKYISKFVGTKLEVLVENFDSMTDSFFGHTSNYLELNFKNEEKDKNLTNNFVEVKVNFDNVKI